MIRRLPQALVLVLLVSGCSGRQSGSGAKIETSQDLKPDATVPVKASLKIGEVNMPVEIRQKNELDTVRLEIDAHGQTFETEVYRATEKSFDLVDAAGEIYDKPLPLLKFPMNVGDTWKWVGTMRSGDEPHKASATVTSASESIMVPSSGSTESVLVVVDLNIESGGPTPANRKLRFWFVKDRGLLKRQFGIGSSREPSE